MHSSLLRRTAALATVLSLAAAGTAAATNRGAQSSRTLFATTDQGQLIQFESKRPERIESYRTITGLPAGVTLAGIDFRPATGDLYGVGSDSVVYRVNPRTAIAVAEGPAFTPGINGRSFGVDFNPVVDKIRVVSDAGQNLWLGGGARPVRADAMVKAGTIDQGLYGKLPPVNGTPVFPTIDQATKAATYLADNWANAVN